MRSQKKSVTMAALLCLLAGCTDNSSVIQLERDARIQAQRRESTAVRAASTQQEKKEFWQLTASGLAVTAVILLVVGVGVGSVTKHDEPKS